MRHGDTLLEKLAECSARIRKLDDLVEFADAHRAVAPFSSPANCSTVLGQSLNGDNNGLIDWEDHYEQ
jgi:hypothetical protein